MRRRTLEAGARTAENRGAQLESAVFPTRSRGDAASSIEARAVVAATLVSRSVGELELLVLGADVPSREDWSAHCERVRDRVRARTLGELVAVFSAGGTPDAVQRHQFTQVFGDSDPFPVRIAVCTDSLVVRGVMTTFSWFGMKGLRAFSGREPRKVFEWLAPRSLALPEFEFAVDEVVRERGWRRAAET